MYTEISANLITVFENYTGLRDIRMTFLLKNVKSYNNAQLTFRFLEAGIQKFYDIKIVTPT